jgi:hypothetical protein
MRYESTPDLGELEVLILFDWLDGVLEGILRRKDENICWYFKIFAERPETSKEDDRLFGLWEISASNSAILITDFGDISEGMHMWPACGGIGSAESREIVERLQASDRGVPKLIVRTLDFIEIADVWNVVLN